MGIDVKQDFIRQAEERLANILTAADMKAALREINDVLQGFRMEALRTEAWEMDGDDMLSAFVASMQVQGRSRKTIYRYRYVIGKFMDYIGVTTRQINVNHIRNWIAAEKNRGIQESTLEGTRQVLSSYFGWLFREGLIERNPMSNLGVIKVPKKVKKIYSGADIEKLTRNCETTRDRAIVRFLASTGCRISEMTELNRDAINLDSGECVVHGKGDKERVVFMDDVAAMMVGSYLKSRTDDDPALFVSERGARRMEPGGVRIMLKKLGEKAGVDHVHPHKFRRTLATNLSRHGMPLQEVASILGHEKLDTTMRYVVLNKEDTKAYYRRLA